MLRVMPKELSGPLSDLVAEVLPVWLSGEGYTTSTAAQILAVARGLSGWMDEERVEAADIRVGVLAAFEAAYGLGVAGHTIVEQRMPALSRFLVGQGILADAVAPSKLPRPPTGAEVKVSEPAVVAELDEWGQWQSRVGGIGKGCIENRRRWSVPLVERLPIVDGRICWAACDVETLNAFIVERSRGLSPASATGILDATKSLMRWALATGRVTEDPRGGILRRRTTRASLPKALSREDLSALIGACDRGSVTGVRDFAVITVLSRLGLRSGETSRLGLDDINWEAGRLQVVGKGRQLTLPVPVDVGEALVAWLEVRPESPTRRVFVRVRPPAGPLSPAGISDIVKHRAKDAGLGSIRAHRLRHTAGTNVLRDGGDLLEAQELLGHQSASSTRVYARVDLAALRALTVELGRLPR